MMNKFKKYILIGIAALVFSCNPNLVDEPSLAATEEDFFSDASEFRRVLTGAYATLLNFYHYGGDQGWVHSLWLLPGDDLTESGARRTAIELFNNNLNPTFTPNTRFFTYAYQMIQRANMVLEKVETVDYSEFENAAEVPMMSGEANFLRAYAYFHLYNMYGSVPVILRRVSDRAEANIPKSPALDVLNQVITDSRNAIDLVPETWPDHFAGRVTKNAARGLLVKALVFRANYTGDQADYNEAVTVFNTITATLVPDFIDNFNALTENNVESLFEVQASEPGNQISNLNLINDGAWRGVENHTVYRGNMMQPGDPGPFNHYTNTRFLITEKLLNNFGTDPRISIFLNPEDGFNGRIFQKYNLPEGVNVLNMFHGGSMNNERVLRYADVVLLAAEAKLKTGDPLGAIGLVNAVRTRARNWALTAGLGDGTFPADYNTGETNPATIMQWIMDERFVELAGEGHRFWDLKRWHHSGDVNLSGWGGGIEHFSTFLQAPFEFNFNQHLVFPIPQDEMDRNAAITENNPGY